MNRYSVPSMHEARPRSTTQEVFDTLYREIITFELEPGAKLSEVDVATRLDVSRQPVRDAFFRLSRIGFLLVRPQRPTLVTRISTEDVLQAAYVRQALEVACLRDVIKRASEADLDSLQAALVAQKAAVDADALEAFHGLDDDFHKQLCTLAGHPYVWPLIVEEKAHMDRVRILSLPEGVSVAYEQHVGLVDAIKARDTERAVERLIVHLERIRDIMERVQANHPKYFDGN